MYHQGRVPSGGSGGNFSCLLLASGARWQPLVFLGLETYHFNLCLSHTTMFFLGMSLCPNFPFLIRTQVIGLESSLIHDDLILSLGFLIFKVAK